MNNAVMAEGALYRRVGNIYYTHEFANLVFSQARQVTGPNKLPNRRRCDWYNQWWMTCRMG